MSGANPTRRPVEVFPIMRALEPEVFDAVFAAVDPLIPKQGVDHPLGCHRQRIPDRTCLFVMLVRLVTGCSWVDAERLTGNVVSDTTLRARRDEWTAAGVFERLAEMMLATYDAVIGLSLGDVAVDGSLHKAPCGGEGTGKSPVDRGKLGWKWSIATDEVGIPIGWITDRANHNDSVILPETLDEVERRGLLGRIATLHLDRGYDNGVVRRHVAGRGIPELVCAPQRYTGRSPGIRRPSAPVPLGLRWPVERTNSWLSNYGQLRRNTDRRSEHRRAQLSFVIAILLIVKLIDQRADART
jgi:transposase